METGSGSKSSEASPHDSVMDRASPGAGTPPLVFVDVTYATQKRHGATRKPSCLRVDHDERLIHNPDWSASLKFQHYDPHSRVSKPSKDYGRSTSADRRHSTPAAVLNTTRRSVNESSPRARDHARSTIRRQSSQYSTMSPMISSSPLRATTATVLQLVRESQDLTSNSRGRRVAIPPAPYASSIRHTSPPKPSSKKTGVKPESKNDPAKVLGILVKLIAVDMSNVLCYYHYLIGLRTTNAELEKAMEGDLGRKWLNPLILSSSTLLSAITLLTLTHLRRLRDQLPTSATLLQTRGTVLQDMFTSIAKNPDRVADGVLLSGVVMSAYERIYGNPECCDVHVQGLQRIVQLRGGVVEKGMVDRWLGELSVDALLGVKPKRNGTAS